MTQIYHHSLHPQLKCTPYHPLQAVDDDGHEATRAPKAKPTLDAEKFSKAFKAIQEGRYSVDELKATYNLSKEQEGQL